jgi:bifunctional DNase/RNase
MWIEMKVSKLMMDPLSNLPVLILQDAGEKRSLPIWVGMPEANAIAIELEKISTPRPMTHDLIKSILEALDVRVVKVVVNDLRENTFYAALHLKLGGAEVTVDSRPSDAIALALRVGAPIYVEEDVVARAKTVEIVREPEAASGGASGEDPAKEQTKVKEWLESIKPGDFLEKDKESGGPDEP